MFGPLFMCSVRKAYQRTETLRIEFYCISAPRESLTFNSICNFGETDKSACKIIVPCCIWIVMQIYLWPGRFTIFCQVVRKCGNRYGGDLKSRKVYFHDTIIDEGVSGYHNAGRKAQNWGRISRSDIGCVMGFLYRIILFICVQGLMLINLSGDSYDWWL